MQTVESNSSSHNSGNAVLCAVAKKYRLKQIYHPAYNVTSYRIEKKHWLGFWYEPSITYPENATFYKREEAEKWFDFLTGKTKVETTIIAG